MNEHATRAIERARLAENATEADAWAYAFDAVEALSKSIRAGERGTDQQQAIAKIKDAFAAQFRRNLKHPIDAAAVPGAQWGGKSDV